MEKEVKHEAKVQEKTTEKKSVEVKHEAKTEKHTKPVSKKVKKDSAGVHHSLFIGLVLIQFVVIIILAIAFASQDNTNVSQDELIKTIDERTARIDSFFAANAPGYGDDSAQVPSEPAAPAEKIELSQLDVEGEPMIGDKDAKITIVEFSDYECPFCAKFYSETYLQLKADYIDTGKVNLIFKDFPLGFHELAIPAAAAANCVQAQLGDEKYFEMHDMIFENQAALSLDNLAKWATDLGADEDKYNTCVVDEEVINEINADLQLGAAVGVSGTPSFFIDGELLVGAQPYQVIKQAIDTALNQ